MYFCEFCELLPVYGIALRNWKNLKEVIVTGVVILSGFIDIISFGFEKCQ